MRVVPHYVLLKKNYEVTQTTFLQVVLDMLRVILSYVVRRALSSVFWLMSFQSDQFLEDFNVFGTVRISQSCRFQILDRSLMIG